MNDSELGASGVETKHQLKMNKHCPPPVRHLAQALWIVWTLDVVVLGRAKKNELQKSNLLVINEWIRVLS